MDTGSHRIRKTAQKATENASQCPEESSLIIEGTSTTLIDIRATGDLILDVTFENRKSSQRLLSSHDVPSRVGTVIKHTKSLSRRLLYRVRLETLRKTSKYFELLLGSDRFSEGKEIAAVFASLRIRDILPSEAEPQDLPRIAIADDDETTRVGGREAVLTDLLQILHGGEIDMRPTIPYLAILSIMADRFDCATTVARYFKGAKKLPWPPTFGNLSAITEELLRQKILISWLLDDQVKFAAATRELVLRGSLRWAGDASDGSDKEQQATWWDLQDGLESELHLRRACMLSTVASLISHFIALYTSRERQCKQYYDSSAACDSYQLGEMIKFLTQKGLLKLVSPLSTYDEGPEVYRGDVENLITVMRQCPAYQIDQNHGHCGLRARIIPALDYIQAMLSTHIGISRRGWKSDRQNHSWTTSEGGEAFRFTRSVAGDQRLKTEGYLMADRFAKALFTAGRWDWSPEE